MYRYHSPTNIYKAVYPLYIMSKWCCMLPYSYDKVANRYVRSVLLLIINLIVVTIYTLCFLLVSYQNTIDETMNSISNVSSWFELYSGIMLQTIGVVMNCFYSKRLVKLFRQLDSIDVQLTQLGQRLHYKGTFIFVVLGICIGFIEFSVTLPSDYVFFLTDESVLFIFCSYVLIILNAMIKLQYLTFVFLIKQRYEFINKRLIHMANRCGHSRSDDSKIVRNAEKFVLKEDYVREYVNIMQHTYYKMWKIVIWINRIYGLQVLITVASAFSIVTTQYYLIYESSSKLSANYSSSQVAPIYFAFQWSYIQMFEVWVIVYYCNGTQNEAKITARLVHELQMKIENKIINAQLKLFSLHILHQDIIFTGCNLFPLNKTTLHSILAAITTYIVVMIQYDLASKKMMTLYINFINNTVII